MMSFDSLSFIWPTLLWSLLALPVLVLAYLVHLYRLGRQRTRYPGLLSAGPQRSGGRGVLARHGGIVLMACALGLLLIALARPRAMLQVPTALQTVMLAIDTSGSMKADDIRPSRIEAARTAAETFIEQMPSRVRIGLVGFASTAALLQAPTHDRDELLNAIRALTLQRGSAPGAAILVSLAELLPSAGIDVQKIMNDSVTDPNRAGRPQGQALDARRERSAAEPAEVEPGSNRSAMIILLTDGEGNVGPKALEMAALAARHGVRVHTVGIGTREGSTLRAEGMSMRVRLDEATLTQIADLTLGEYFPADSARELARIYQSLSARIAFERRATTEITGLLAAAAAVLILIAAALSLARTGRIA